MEDRMDSKITLSVSFTGLSGASKALAALRDRGAKCADISFAECRRSVRSAVAGITTTTRADAALGANRGAALALLLGSAAACSSVWISGHGIVPGGGALPSALLGLVGVLVAGCLSGAAAGYLHDQGAAYRKRSQNLADTAIVLIIQTPTGCLGEFEVLETVSKYSAKSFDRSGPT